MRLTDVEVSETAKGATLAAKIVWEKASYPADRIEFTYRGLPASDVSTPGDALATAVLVPCMAVGEDLRMDVPVCGKLLEGLRRVEESVRGQHPRWRGAHIDAPAADRSTLEPTEVTACFSGGVDSFFTALRPRSEPISTLITQAGRTLYPELAARWEEAVPVLASAAEMLGMDHLVVDSNAFPMGAKYVKRRTVNWHGGAVVAAMALGLGARIRRCYIAAALEGTRAYSWAGSHYALDPLYSSAPVEIVHDGAEIDRLDKVKSIAHHEAVLRYLRVCTRRRPYPENCRVCDKCQFTALAFQLAGVLERCETIGPVSADTIRRTVIGSVPRWRDEFELLRDRLDDPEMRDAIDAALRRSRRRARLHPLAGLLRRIGAR